MEIELTLYFAMFFLVGFAPPLRWAWRFSALLIMTFLFAATVRPIPHAVFWELKVIGEIAFWTLVPNFVGLALRFLIEMIVLKGPFAKGADRHFLTAFDACLRFSISVLAGCLIFFSVALTFESTNAGLALHLLVAGIAVALVFALRLLRKRWSALLMGAGLTVAGLALDGGLRYPDLILTEANRVRPGQPRCLMLSDDLIAPTSRQDLMALTLSKSDTALSSVILLVQGDGGPRLFRWSFRARAFVTLPPDTNETRFCTPTHSPLSVD